MSALGARAPNRDRRAEYEHGGRVRHPRPIPVLRVVHRDLRVHQDHEREHDAERRDRCFQAGIVDLLGHLGKLRRRPVPVETIERHEREEVTACEQQRRGHDGRPG